MYMLWSQTCKASPCWIQRAPGTACLLPRVLALSQSSSQSQSLRTLFFTPVFARVPSALPGTLLALTCVSVGRGMRSGRALSTLPRGAVTGVAAAPAPLGVCLCTACCSSPPSCCFVSRSVGRGMRSGRALSTLPRGALTDVAAAPAPLGVCLCTACCSSPPSRCFVSRKVGTPPPSGHRAI